MLSEIKKIVIFVNSFQTVVEIAKELGRVLTVFKDCMQSLKLILIVGDIYRSLVGYWLNYWQTCAE